MQTKTIRVLLLEDSNEDAEFVRESLDPPSGVIFDVVHKRTMTTALRYLELREVDVALVDLGLPDSSEAETLPRLREPGHSFPIVVLSGTQSPSVNALGAQEVIQKWEMEGAAVSRSLLYVVEQHRHALLARRVAKSHVDATLVVDFTGVIRFANDAAEEILRSEATPVVVGSVFPHVIIPGETTELSFEGVGTLEARCTTMPWDNETAYLVSMRDISDRLRAEELRRRLAHTSRLAAMGQLAAGVAHELNNPISYIRSNLELSLEHLQEVSQALQAGRSLRPEEQLERIEEVIDMSKDNLVGAMRMASIVGDFRMFSRIDKDEYELVDVSDLLESACTMVRAEINHRAVLKKALDAVPMIVADRAKLTQVFTNILMNAAQAIAVGARADNQVGVRLSREGDSLVIMFTDTGVGIAEDLLERIFDPFFTTKPREVGTGLGLSLSMEIIRQHGGTIDASSSEMGSLFRIILPIRSALHVGKQKEVKQKNSNEQSRILFVDDDACMLRSLRRRLEKRDRHQVSSTGEAEEALRMVTTSNFDVIICDVMMPNCDGVEFFQRLRNDVKCETPLVFVTGGVFSDTMRNFVDTSGVPVIEKPVDYEELMLTIRHLVSADRSQQEV